MSDKLLLPITEAAERLGVGRTKTYELLDAGELEAVHIGRRRLVAADSIEAYVRRLRDAA